MTADQDRTVDPLPFSPMWGEVDVAADCER